jgi:hypothetical protein
MSSLIAYLLLVISIIIIYRGLLKLLKIIYSNNPIWCFGFIIVISPFVYLLAQFNDPLELIWVLLLTPFYGITVLSSIFTHWIIIYYNMAFSFLALVCSLYYLKHHNLSLRNTLSTLVLAIILMDVIALSPIIACGESSRDPTYREALQFILSDKTNLNQYHEGTYTCANFAVDVENNAVKSGYKCGYVIVFFPDGESHAIDCFNTTDRGLIFIEPQTDAVVTLNLGQPYWNRSQYGPQNYDDTVARLSIDWPSNSREPAYSRLFLMVASICCCNGLIQMLNYRVANSILNEKNKLAWSGKD